MVYARTHGRCALGVARYCRYQPNSEVLVGRANTSCPVRVKNRRHHWSKPQTCNPLRPASVNRMKLGLIRTALTTRAIIKCRSVGLILFLPMRLAYPNLTYLARFIQ